MTVVISRLLISLLTLIICFVLFKPMVKFNMDLEFINTARQSIEYGLSEILAMIYSNIDMAILPFFSISETGLYSPASGAIHALYIIPNSIFVYLIPQYAKMFDKQGKFSLKRIFGKFVLIFFLIGFILSVCLFIGGELFVTFLLDNRFAATSSVIRILSPIMLFKSLAFSFALLIVITGNQRRRLLPQFLVSCINIILNIALIPHFGLVGVAWVYTLSELALMVSYFLIANNIINYEEAKTS